MTPAGAVEVGRRVFLRAPAARDRDEFLALMSASRRFLRPWIKPPADRGGFRSAYLGFYAGASFAGQGYMSEGLRLVGNRASIRLVGRWRDHERWAITAEDLRR